MRALLAGLFVLAPLEVCAQIPEVDFESPTPPPDEPDGESADAEFQEPDVEALPPERWLALDDPREEEEEEAPAERVADREVVMASPRGMLGAQGALFLETGLTRGRWADARVWGWSTELGLRYRVAEEVTVEASWGVTYGHALVIGETEIDSEPVAYNQHVDRVQPGNPTLGGLFVHRASMLLLELGVMFSIPTASRSDVASSVDSVAVRHASEVVNRSAMAMRGYRSANRFAPERFSIAVPLRVAIPVRPLVLELDAGLAIMLPVLGDRGVDTDVLIEIGAALGTQVHGPFYLGARLAGVGSAVGTTAPSFTFSAEPFARLRFDPVQLTLRGVMNLAGEDAVGGDRGPSFGIFLGAGVEL